MGSDLVNLLSLHLLNLVFPNTSPHDVGDCSCDETEMDVNLNPAMEAKDVSVSGVGAIKLLQYTLSLFRLLHFQILVLSLGEFSIL